jgi:uncharacterized iron-regulated protein
MRRGLLVLLGWVAVLGPWATGAGALPLYDLQNVRRTSLAEIAPQLTGGRIVLVGEHHTEERHHRAQVQVIQHLVQAGAKVAIGLEMFRRDSQPDLDRWIAGAISPGEFEPVFTDNWGYPWAAYRAIFEYARAQKLPMIGLNLAREITRQVARGGFQSLTEAQRGQLPEVTCSVDEEYLRYMRKVHQAHAHGSMNFTHFCEAQMVWDTAMAIYALEHLQANPEATVVVLTGVGHAQKGAVPRQIRMRSPVPVTVFLPEVPGSIDMRTTDVQDADYLLLDLE